jgi:ABC-2 type transport system ATP-binding protein
MGEMMLQVQNVHKNYGAVNALSAINLAIEKGSSFGLIGPNGAGKSTLMKIVTGILPQFEGEVKVLGRSISSDRIAVKKRIGYVPQDICLEETLSTVDNLRLFGALYGLKGRQLKTRIEEVLGAIGLTDYQQKKVSTFSGGMKRRLNIGCALLHEPDLVIMDEPTVGIDPQSRNHIYELINRLKENGSTIIYTSHYMEEVEQLCDTVALIDQGTIVESGKVSELMKRYSVPSVYVEGEALSAEHLTAFENVVPKNGGFVINTNDPLAVIEKLVGYCRTRGLNIHRLEMMQPRLEEMFFKLTGTELRD